MTLLLTRPPDAAAQTLDEYRALGGYGALERARAGTLTAEATIAAIAEAHLHGHGGAGFPTARKWQLAREQAGSPKYVVVNGGEHEPGSRKDRLLLERYPHWVLEGAALCAFATGASTIYVYMIDDMHEARASIERALQEARRAGLLGQPAGGSPDDGSRALRFEVIMAPATYVAGEETAALEVIEGKKAWPRKKPPYPGQAGVHGQPTTVNNVETLAWAAGITNHGTGWFGPGAMICTLDDSFARPGVVEVPLGTTFRAVIKSLGGGTRGGRAVKGILPAMSSAFLPATALDVPLTYADVRKAGSNLGCGGISLLLQGQCAVERLVEISAFFMREQCGQCPPCRMETNTLAGIVKRIAAGESLEYRAQIVKITEFARGRGNCNLIEMAAAPVLSALVHFAADFEHHVTMGRCPE